jgi:DNA processing protein
MEQGGKTVAVLGTPLSQVYPPSNRGLQALIMEQHLAISQFPEGIPIRKSNFPRRNRTMALIADASVIVEAGNTSGALSQGWEALRLGRPLFVMRSVAEDPTLTWPEEMQSYGARVLEDSNLDDLLSLLPSRVGDPVAGLSF